MGFLVDGLEAVVVEVEALSVDVAAGLVDLTAALGVAEVGLVMTLPGCFDVAFLSLTLALEGVVLFNEVDLTFEEVGFLAVLDMFDEEGVFLVSVLVSDESFFSCNLSSM